MPTLRLLLLPLALLALVAGAVQEAARGAQDPAPEAPAAEVADETAAVEVPTAVDGRPVHLPGWEDVACADCHREIAEEWAGTLHAQAWIDEVYQKALETKRRPQSCWGCHIPEPLHLAPLGQKPRPRDDVEEDPRHHGVSCTSCHLGPDGVMLGPFESGPGNEISGAHDSRQHESFVEGPGQDALCIACHRTNVGPVIGIAKDFELTRQADKGRSCVGCHMPEVERSHAVVTKDDGSVYTAPVRPGRRHTLNTPRDPGFLAKAFELEPLPGGVGLSVGNNAGHRIPGLKTRTMTFRVEALDADGAVLGSAEAVISAKDFLAVDGSLRIPVETGGAAAASLRVVGLHEWLGPPEPQVFVDEVLDLE